MGLIVVTPPANEPVSIDDIRLHVRADGVEEDDLLQALIVAAREVAERITGKALVTQTLKATFDCFPDWYITLPRPPLASVTSIVYLDSDGDEQTLDAADYRVITSQMPGFVEPAYGTFWPATLDVSDAVRVTYVAGVAYGAVSSAVIAGIKLLVAHWYKNREEVITGTISSQIPMGAEALFAGEWIGQYLPD